MHSRRILLTAALSLCPVLLTACGHVTDAQPTHSSKLNPSQSSSQPAANGLTAGITVGTYQYTRRTAGCSGPSPATCGGVTVAREQGSFDLSRPAIQFDIQVVRPPGTPLGLHEISMRQLGPHTVYVRFVEKGDECWTKPDFASPILEMNLTTGLKLLREAKPAGAPNMTFVAAMAPALDAVEALGVQTDVNPQQGMFQQTHDVLARSLVPVTLTEGPGDKPVGFRVDGLRLAAALNPNGQLSLANAYLAQVENATATFTLSNVGRAPVIKAPADNLIKPAKAPDTYACPPS